MDDRADLTQIPQDKASMWLFHHLDTTIPWANSSALSNLNDSFIVFHTETDSGTLRFHDRGSLTFKVCINREN